MRARSSRYTVVILSHFFFFQAEDGIRDIGVTGVQTCALPISSALLPPASTLGVRNMRGRLAGRVPRAGRRTDPWRADEAGAWGSEERRVGEEGRSPWAPDH